MMVASTRGGSAVGVFEPFPSRKIVMKFVRSAVLCLTAVSLAGLQGCAGFRGNKLAAVTPDQLTVPSAPVKVKVFTKWKNEATADKLPENALVAGAALNKKSFDETLASAGCCATVESVGDADLVVEGTSYIEFDSAAMIPAFITGLSLYTIPSWVTSKIKMSARAQKGTLAKTYEAEDSFTMVQWLPLIVALPFANPITMGKDVEKNAFQTIVVRMKADGLLVK